MMPMQRAFSDGRFPNLTLRGVQTMKYTLRSFFYRHGNAIAVTAFWVALTVSLWAVGQTLEGF